MMRYPHVTPGGHGLLCAALLSGLVVSAVPSGLQAEPPFAALNVGAPIWNGSILFTDQVAAQVAATGCRFVRVNFRIDGHSSWTPAHLASYDTIVANARNHSLEILGLICYEAHPEGQAQWNDDADGDGLNPYVYSFADIAYLLFERYKNDIKVWEIWNEPDCWSVDPAYNDPRYVGCSYVLPRVYASLLAETWRECNYNFGRTLLTDYGIVLSSGGLFAHEIGGINPPTGYAQDVYARTATWNAFLADTGRRYPWDYFGMHLYLDQGQAVQTWKLAYYLNQMQSKKSQWNDPTDFFITEIGWNTAYPEMPQQLQADNLRDSFNYFRGRGDVASVHWFTWADFGGSDQWGLTAGGVPKLSYYEFVNQCGAAGPPVAAFTAYPTSGVAPLVVQFTDMSSGLIDTWSWDFGDGQSSTDVDPAHTYLVGGTYAVTLTVSGPGGSDSETKGGYITVSAAPNPADLDGDGDCDLADFAIFARCYGGSGVLTVPAGCETEGGPLPPATHTYQLAANLAGLGQAISAVDRLQGMIGEIEDGGFYPAVPGGDAGGLVDLTDGVAGSSLEAVLADFARPALQVRYTFSPPRDLDHIHVFAANVDGRVFQNYDVHYSMVDDPEYQTLLENVVTGPFGQSNPGTYGASLTRIVSSQSGPIALDVDELRFTFYAVSGTDNGFRDEFDPGEAGDTDGFNQAFQSSIIKEVDVFEYSGPPPTGNLADLDGDGDADLADLSILESYLAGPQ